LPDGSESNNDEMEELLVGEDAYVRPTERDTKTPDLAPVPRPDEPYVLQAVVPNTTDNQLPVTTSTNVSSNIRPVRTASRRRRDEADDDRTCTDWS
jgi:hypothetical protein